MSDIERFRQFGGAGIWLGRLETDRYGEWVRYDDHRAEVERVIADVVKLRIDLNSAQVAANQRRADVERLKNAIDHLTSERDEAQAEVERLQSLLTEESKSLPKLIDSMTSQLRATADRVTAERDAAQAEVERLRANGQAILDSSRPDDETIWREAFMAAIERGRVYDRMTVADLALAEYRKRWPR